MAIFEYSGKDTRGLNMTGIIDAATEDIAIDILEERGITIYSLKKRETSNFLSSLNLDVFNGVRLKDVVVFSRQLAVMIGATLPIVKALKILIKQTENVKLKVIISEIADDVEGGAKLSLALSKHPKVFTPFFINMVKSGETSGKLSEVLNYLADQLEKDYDLRAKIKGAMIYPAFIFSGLIVVGVIMMVFVIPKITGLVREVGGELPLPTRILIATSDFMVQYWIILLGLLIATIVGLLYYRRTEQGKKQVDLMLLKIPVFGELFQKIYLVQFTRSLSTLIVGKVPLPVALRIVEGVLENEVYKEMIAGTIKEVEDGNSISTVFAKNTDIVPAMLTNMLSVGEQTGRIHEVLEKMTDFYSREIDNMVANVMTLIEPVVLVVMGVAVGGMVAAILLPTFNLASQI